MERIIKNAKELKRSLEREHAIEIMESAYKAINTREVISKKVSLNDEKLIIDERSFDLRKYKHVRVIGFGKASCEAILEIEKILKGIKLEGLAIDKKPGTCETIKVYQGAHPRPTDVNVEISGKIVNLAKESNEEDLVIVIVSGGGSSLLCWPQSECTQSVKLYDKFLSLGSTIKELNTVRKHISLLKGGGLAKFLYPATVVSLVLCDVPGEHFDIVASGPTYKDESTLEDAKQILSKYDLSGEFELTETPKEDKFFEKVLNVPVVSNIDALIAMEKKATELGYQTESLGPELYDFTDKVLKNFVSRIEAGKVVIGGGEPRLIIKKDKGIGGRNLRMSLESLKYIGPRDTFSSFASDGLDNQSEYAGALVDASSKETGASLGLDVDTYIEAHRTEEFLKKTRDVIETGPTGSNVSDLMLLIRKNE